MKSSMKTSTVKKSLKKSSKLTTWPKNAEERKKLYDKYSSGKEKLSYKFLEMMIKGEDMFKGVTKQILKRAYIKADEIGDSKSEGLITRKEFPYFLKYLLYFTDLFKVFDKIDEDKNNKLTLDEFIKNRMVLEDKMAKEKAEDVFKSMDEDGGGSISFDQFCNWALEQSSILQYNNKEFFVVDQNLQDDEDPEEGITKTQESEEIKEEEGSPLHKLSDLDEKDNEIMVLKARILELDDIIRGLQQKVLEGSSGGGDSNLLEELQKLREMHLDHEKKILEFEQREVDFRNQVELKSKDHQNLLNELQRKLNETLQRETKLNEELELKSKENSGLISKNELNSLQKLYDEVLRQEAKLKEDFDHEKKFYEENHQKVTNNLEDLNQKLKEENTKQTNELNAQIQFKEETAKREAKMQEDFNEKIKEFEARIVHEEKRFKDLEEQNQKLTTDFTTKLKEADENLAKEEKSKVEIEGKLRVLEALNKDVNGDDLKKQIVEFESNKIQEEQKKLEMENKIKNLEKELSQFKANHEQEIDNANGLKKQLEEKIRTLEQSHFEKQVHEEKELKSKLLDFDQKEEKMKMAYESKIKDLEKDLINQKNNVLEHEKTNSELKKSYDLKLHQETEKWNSMKHTDEERIKTLEQINQGNLKANEIEEKIEAQYDTKINDLNKELNLYKITVAEHEKALIDLKKTYEIKFKQEVEAREKAILSEKEGKFVNMKDETEKLKKKIYQMDMEMSDIKKKNLEELRTRKDSDADISKIITENKAKEEIYGLLGQNKTDSTSNDIVIKMPKDNETGSLRRSLTRMKIFVACTSLIGLGLLLVLLLKDNNCKETK